MEYYNQNYFANKMSVEEFSDSNNSSEQPTPTKVQSTPSQSVKATNTQGFFKGIINFLNSKTGNILTFAICFCIGGAFKDFIQSVITDLVQPLIIKLLVLTNIYEIAAVSSLLSEKSSVFNVSSMISSLLSFLVTFLTVYVIFTAVSTATGI